MKLIKMIVVVLMTAVIVACGTEQTAQTPATGDNHSNMPGMNHSSTQATTAPYDAQFIDGMTIHHKAAVTMAQQALKDSERPEIKQLAQNIIATQTAEIEQMAAWRSQWYANVPITDGTGGHMGDMELSSDTTIPFDQRFITAMIGHHNGAIEMAKEAQTKAEHQEIKQLAQSVITAQEAEVKQLKEWQQAWFSR